MLARLKELNPTLALYDVTDPAFAAYGRIVEMDTAEILRVADAMARPTEGAAYLPSVDAFEALPIHKEITERIFGTLPTQTGYCHGRNSSLDATEWHHSSELNIAVTPIVLILGKRKDFDKDGVMDSADMKAFLLPRGIAVEVYGDSTHYCAIQVSDEGFGAVVALPKDTNTALDTPVTDPLLFAKNKWLVAHAEAKSLVAKGAVVGIKGENYTVKY